uniref:Uncharacterized protein n=1 Tax=Anguilla anguilla TaxID=7936 RepID=A0A0E9P5W1_ANGAN
MRQQLKTSIHGAMLELTVGLRCCWPVGTGMVLIQYKVIGPIQWTTTVPNADTRLWGFIHTLEQCLNRHQTTQPKHTLEQCFNRMSPVFSS